MYVHSNAFSQRLLVSTALIRKYDIYNQHFEAALAKIVSQGIA
jgi:hypothetical protein